MNQGPLSATTPTSWLPNHTYVSGNLLLDSNNNIEIEIFAIGNSGTTPPAWNATAGGYTIDGFAVLWRNLGAIATSALTATGGTSGIIIDNTVGSGTLAGASEIYYTTLDNQTCVTSGGTGGCAVQASQAALQ